MKKQQQLTRRHFLGRTTAAGGLLIMDGLFGGAQAANDKLNIGVVGVAGRGGGNLKGVSGENIVALCDVDAPLAQGVCRGAGSGRAHAARSRRGRLGERERK